MLIIKIQINDKLIHEIKAKNISPNCDIPYGKGKQFYEVKIGNGDKFLLEHVYEEGAEILAEKILNRINNHNY